ncbi:RNA pyrophosphohydrolase, partial [Salmonella enterica subsp. enterica serovar Virchow]|nr:RNA pyrophosphohydrolase [Salmonella enterica subsp. enterica serovar Virchow]
MAKTKIDPADLPYRPCVGVMVLNSAGLVWVGRRKAGEADSEV